MRNLITLLSGLILLTTVVVLGGCANGYYGGCYHQPEVVIIELPPGGCNIPPACDPVVVQSPRPRTTPMDRTPVKSPPPPRTKTPRGPRTR